MSDSGRQIGDCVHGHAKEQCPRCRTLWLITFRVCSECGGRLFVRLLDHKPTLEERVDLRDARICGFDGMTRIEVNSDVVEVKQE